MVLLLKAQIGKQPSCLHRQQIWNGFQPKFKAFFHVKPLVWEVEFKPKLCINISLFIQGQWYFRIFVLWNQRLLLEAAKFHDYLVEILTNAVILGIPRFIVKPDSANFLNKFGFLTPFIRVYSRYVPECHIYPWPKLWRPKVVVRVINWSSIQWNWYHCMCIFANTVSLFKWSNKYPGNNG